VVTGSGIVRLSGEDRKCSAHTQNGAIEPERT
jgi:hypothetical protein